VQVVISHVRLSKNDIDGHVHLYVDHHLPDHLLLEELLELPHLKVLSLLLDLYPGHHQLGVKEAHLTAEKEVSQQAEKEVYLWIEAEEVCLLIINPDLKVKVEVILLVQQGVGHLDGEKVNLHRHHQIDEVLLKLHNLNFFYHVLVTMYTIYFNYPITLIKHDVLLL